MEPVYTELPKLLPDCVFSDFVTTPVPAAEHGEAISVRGAARLWARSGE